MTYPNISTARVAIAEMVAADQSPTLQDHEIEDVIRGCQMRDADGRKPTDANYIITVNAHFIASKLWLRKASKCAAQFDFSSDNQSFKRSQQLKHCLEMSKEHSKLVMQGWPTDYQKTIDRFKRGF